MSLQDCCYSVQHGYVEALCRGLKQGLLTPDEYSKITQSDNLDDVRSALEETDYGTFMQDEASPIGMGTIATKLKQKFADDFRHLRAQSSNDFLTFFDFIVAEKMIDNLIVLLQGALNEAPPTEMEARCHPLGFFSGMRAVATIDITSGYDELYRTLLVDTPIGPYVETYLHELSLANPQGSDNKGGAGGAAVEANAGPHQVGLHEVGGIIREVDLEILRNLLKKNWLEDFNRFCQTKTNQTTAEVMGHILNVEADMRLFGVALNTMNQNTQIDRNALFPAMGYLYPELSLSIRKAYNLTQMRQALGGQAEYSKILDKVAHLYAGEEDDERIHHMGNDKQKTFEDLLYERMVALSEEAFEQQMHFGVVYAWVKLREQEIRNILWICDMVVMGRREDMGEIIEIFKPYI